ncbi:MAG: CRISPR system precrRNA processing endoribonuclease RAMP protein Cas6 [Deltaproteobacteria bacterium]|nr:CRISPR system precrRNA processing endoribonuclease RAMP protein Cas6 [Deltaproteobacteria bacterium]
MLFGKYRFICELQGDAILPYYKGSTFRGVFGHALKRVVCVLKQRECEACPLKARCVYATVFETPVAMQVPEGSKISTPPHPFVIEPPLTEQRDFKKGETFECALLLFGKVNKYIPHFVYAFAEMGKLGIGKRVNGRRAGFRLEEVRNGTEVLYSAREQYIKRDHPIEHLALNREQVLSDGKTQKATPIRVTLQTPLRLKFRNALSRADLPFHVLVRAMLRRVSALFNVWNGGEPDLDYRGLVRRAEDVTMVRNDLSWFDWQRYSNRHERRMLMGGMVGSVVYEGRLGEFMPLLELSSKVHLGKNTSFGLGKMDVNVL